MICTMTFNQSLLYITEYNQIDRKDTDIPATRINNSL